MAAKNNNIYFQVIVLRHTHLQAVLQIVNPRTI